MWRKCEAPTSLLDNNLIVNVFRACTRGLCEDGMKPKFILVTSYSDDCDVEIVKDRYCPRGSVYIMPDKTKPLLDHLKSLYQAEKERSEWIRKYQNVLDGLNYWKQKALNSP